ncbi:MAG: hypothetical protein WD688_13125 [Candidatus Binatia bacterium]
MVAINARAMIVSLPTLTDVFHANLSIIQWALLVYDLAVIGLVLTLSRLGDLFGRKWLTHGLYTGGMTSEQIESPRSWGASPEIFLGTFSQAVHVVNLFALFAVIFSAIRGGSKD